MSVLKIQVRKIKSKILVTCKILDFLFFLTIPITPPKKINSTSMY